MSQVVHFSSRRTVAWIIITSFNLITLSEVEVQLYQIENSFNLFFISCAISSVKKNYLNVFGSFYRSLELFVKGSMLIKPSHPYDRINKDLGHFFFLFRSIFHIRCERGLFRCKQIALCFNGRGNKNSDTICT